MNPPKNEFELGMSSSKPGEESQETPLETFDLRVASLIKRETAFYAALVAARDLGCEISQEYIDRLAAAYRVYAPKLARSESRPALFGYHLTAGILTVNEARERLGYEPLPGEEGKRLLGGAPVGSTE